jgi:nucleoid DNA-binding protein
LQELILKYLSIHHSISIKGWGSLLLKEEPAQVDFPNKLIHPPKNLLEYSANGAEDPAFIDWLMQQLHFSSSDVFEQLKIYTNQFLQQLNSESIQWAGWGTFSKSGDKTIFLQQLDNITNHEQVIAEKIIRTGTEHSLRVGNEEHTNLEMEEWLHRTNDKKKYLWQILALLLGAIGIILAIIFAKIHQYQWKNYTNLQLLHPKEPPVLYKTP